MLRVLHRYLYRGLLYKDTIEFITGGYRGRRYYDLVALRAAQGERLTSYEESDEHLDRVVLMDEIAAKPDAAMYPAIWHLSRIIGASSTAATVVDLGGSAGQHFYQFKTYLPFEKLLSWTVWDLPKISEFGALVAGEKGETKLHFTTEPQDASGCDILYSAGSFQFLGDLLFSDLADMPRLPRHLLLNKIEIADGDQPTFHAVHYGRRRTIRGVVSTYNRSDLLSRLQRIGYQCVDHWRIGDSGHRPIFSNLRIWFEGFVFRMN